MFMGLFPLAVNCRYFHGIAGLICLQFAYGAEPWNLGETQGAECLGKGVSDNGPHLPTADRFPHQVSQPATKPIDIRDGALRGLILTILPSGKRQWCVRYLSQGKHRRLVLGNFPAVSLAQARKLARTEMSHVDAGRDVVAERQAANAVRTDTVAALAEEYCRLHARKKKKSAHEDERVLTVYVLPSWRARSARDITRRDVRELVEQMADRAPIMANRVLEIIRKMFNFAIGREWLDGNPAARLEKPGTERSRDRVLTDAELRALWALLSRTPATSQRQAPGRKRAATDEHGAPFCPISRPLADVTKLRLVTAQRGGEVVRMRWADLDLAEAWWTIPATDSKNGQPHRVPLTREALTIITAQQPDEAKRTGSVFTGREGALVDARVKKAGAALSNVLGFEFVSHDLRRTAATRMAAAGIPSAHISHVLNHVAGGPTSTRVYDRHTYDPEKRLALDTWARELRRILSGEPKSASVVPHTRRRA